MEVIDTRAREALDELSLMLCVVACAKNPEYVENWLRLRGHRLPASAIERMIDEASGHSEAIAQQFIADVRELFEFRMPTLPLRHEQEASRASPR